MCHRPALCFATALILLLGAGVASLAFDTGHHCDLTAAVMHEQGFDDTPARIVQVANWLTDYYAISPTSREVVETGLGKLHFDNLYSTDEVAGYWGWLMNNARTAIQDAAASEDHWATLTLVGLVLHAVQDFYAHSNWVETHPRSPGAAYRSETWLAVGASSNTQLVTGSYPPYPYPPPAGSPEHGGYDSGLNKDSHIRPLWDEAYVFAYCASHELLDVIEEWVEQARPGFWRQLQTLELSARDAKKLEFDMEAAHNLSMWVKGKGADGHWKGNESGSVRYMSEFAAEWTSRPASIPVQQIKKHHLHNRLLEGLYSENTPPPIPPIKPFSRDSRVIIVKATHVEQMPGTWTKTSIDPGGKADMYSVITVDRQEYVDRVVREKKSYTDPWMTLHMADASETEIPLILRVWDQDGPFQINSDQCDINPVVGNQNLSMRFLVGDNRLVGDVEGCHDARERPAESGGAKPDKNRIEISFYVTSRPIQLLSPLDGAGPGG